MDEIIEGLKKLTEVWSELSDCMFNLGDSDLDKLSNGYPFEKSFDEYTLGIIEWRNSLIDGGNNYDTF